jgi:hypothetical protein
MYTTTGTFCASQGTAPVYVAKLRVILRVHSIASMMMDKWIKVNQSRFKQIVDCGGRNLPRLDRR